MSSMILFCMFVFAVLLWFIKILFFPYCRINYRVYLDSNKISSREAEKLVRTRYFEYHDDFRNSICGMGKKFRNNIPVGYSYIREDSVLRFDITPGYEVDKYKSKGFSVMPLTLPNQIILYGANNVQVWHIIKIYLKKAE